MRAHRVSVLSRIFAPLSQLSWYLRPYILCKVGGALEPSMRDIMQFFSSNVYVFRVKENLISSLFFGQNIENVLDFFV